MINERKLTKSELDKRENIIMNMKDKKRDLVKKYGKDAEAVMYGRATNMAKKQTKEMRDPKITELIKNALKNPKKADLNKDGKISDYEETRGAAIEKNLEENVNPELDRFVNRFVEKLADRYDYSLQDAVNAVMGVLRKQNYDGLNENKSEIVKYNGEDHEVVRREGDRIYIRRNEPSAILGKLNTFWVKQDDLNEDYKPSLRAYNVIDAEGNVIYSKLPREEAAEKAKEKKEYKFTATDSLAEDLDLGHEDNEPSMIKGDLYQIGKSSMALYKILDQFDDMGEVDLPSWWQSKIFKAKEAVVGAQEYLEFELKEPAIDNAVDDFVGEDVDQLGTDDDTGFTPSLYTPNEMGDASVGGEYASGAFEENLNKDKDMKEQSNANSNDGSNDNSNENSNDNKETYSGLKKFVAEKLAKELKEGLPKGFFDKAMDAEDEDQDGKVDEDLLGKGGKISKALKALEKAASDAKISGDAAKELFAKFEKEMKLSEEQGMDPERFVGSGGDEIDSDSNINITKDNPAQDAEIGFGLEESDEVDESYDTLVNKLKKSGKSKKAAKAIAGAVASYKAKGGGKGPTAKQK